MMSLNIEQAAKDMVGAVDLRSHEAVTSNGVGVTGYCMGGGSRCGSRRCGPTTCWRWCRTTA